MSERIRYEVDPFNRLVAIDRSTSLPKQRRVIDGEFVIGRGNSLEYRIKSPASVTENIPYQVKLQGSWSLTENHDLRFKLDKSTGARSGDLLTIAGDIIDIKGSSILFAVTTKREEGLSNTYVLELGGTWQVDKNNRLTFRIKRGGSRYDTLLLQAGWDISRTNEIVYTYEKSRLKRGEKIAHSLVLKGRWRINRNNALSYEVETNTDKPISFKTSYGICRNDRIVYEIGIKLDGRLRPRMRTVTLFGIWRIKRGSSLFFDVECANGRVYSISFSAEARLNDRDTISFKLKDDMAKKDIGLQLELKHSLLTGDGNTFLRLLKSRDETGVFIGAGINW